MVLSSNESSTILYFESFSEAGRMPMHESAKNPWGKQGSNAKSEAKVKAERGLSSSHTQLFAFQQTKPE